MPIDHSQAAGMAHQRWLPLETRFRWAECRCRRTVEYRLDEGVASPDSNEVLVGAIPIRPTMPQDRSSDCSEEEGRLVSLPNLGCSYARPCSLRSVRRDACREEAAGSGVPRKALNAEEQKGIEGQNDSEEELTPRCVIGSEVVSPAEHEQSDNE